MFSLGTDRYFSVVLICVSAVAFIMIGGGEPVDDAGALNTATYPRVLLALLMAFCAAHVVSKKSGQVKSSFSYKEFVIIAVVLLYILLLSHVGYFILTPLILLLLPIFYGYRNYVAIVLSAVLVMAFLYTIFALVLKVPLP